VVQLHFHLSERMHEGTLRAQPAFFGWLILIAALLGLAGCQGGATVQAYSPATGGTPREGLAVIRQYNCGACHIIPGVPDAKGLVGPPLLFFARRTYIAGELPNTTENLVRWLMSPQSVEPKVAMPNLGLSEDQARSVVAYLYTLR
jgi:cytochrome c1